MEHNVIIDFVVKKNPKGKVVRTLKNCKLHISYEMTQHEMDVMLFNQLKKYHHETD